MPTSSPTGPPLSRRPLGETGLDISILSLGTVKWGRNQQVKYAPFELPEDAILHQLLDLAESAGINLLDTAPAYGIAEERVGKILSERPGHSFFVATKVGEDFENGVSRFDFTRAHTELSLYRSLRRLCVDALDLVMVHCPAEDMLILHETPIMQTLANFRDDGLVRAIGISTMTVAGGLLAAELADFLMVPFSVGYREHESVIDAAKKLRKGVLVKRALYSGPAAASKLSLESHFRPVLEKAGVTSLVAGTINPTHLAENIAVAQKIA